MAEPIYHRIHPLTMVVELPKAIRQMLGLIIVAAVSLFNGGFSAELGGEAIAGLLGLLVIVPPIVRYFSYGYAIHNGDLLIRSGVISKNLRTIPLSRIQNINLKRNLLHRIVGLVDLEIETAAGTKAEASISALDEERAHVVKAQLLGQRASTYTRLNLDRDRHVIYRPTTLEIFLVGATENRMAAILAAILGLAGAQQALVPMLERSGKSFGGSAQTQQQIGLLIAIAFIGMLFLGWIVSIVSAFVKFYGFQLSLEDGKLRREYGLINHFETLLPIRRIQTVHVDRNIIQRLLGICKLYAASAGGMQLSGNAESNDHARSVPLLTPVLRDDALLGLLRVAIPNADFEGTQWHSVGKNTIFRHLRTGFWPAFIVGALLYGLFSIYRLNRAQFRVNVSPFLMSYGPYLAFIALLGLALFSGWIYYQTARYSYSNRLLATRIGWLRSRWNYVPVNKVQLVSVTQNPAQRWLRLATVTAHSAAVLFQHTEIDDMPADEAFRLAEHLHEEAGDTRDALLDGF